MKTYPTNAERQAAYRLRRRLHHPDWPALHATAAALLAELDALYEAGWRRCRFTWARGHLQHAVAELSALVDDRHDMHGAPPPDPPAPPLTEI